MAKPTIRNIHEIVIELTRIAEDLREASNHKTLEGYLPPAIPLGLAGVVGHAASLDEIARTLYELIPEDEIRLGEVPDSDPKI